MNLKKSKIKTIFVFSLLLIFIILVIVSLKGKGYRGKIIHLYKKIAVDTKIDLSQYENFQEDMSAWFQKYRVVAHGLGEIEGNFTTNSKEAFQTSYSNGNRIFEVDISKTIDGKYVLSHEFEGWETTPTYEEFIGTKINGRYTPLSLNWIVDTLEKHSDIYIMTDIKSTDFIDILEKMVNQANYNKQVLGRLIIQVYSEEDLLNTKKVYPFSNILFSTYKSGYMTQKEVAEFCLQNDIPVVTQGAMKNSKKDILYFTEKNIKVYAFTVNSREYAAELMEIGYNGVYSDTFSPNEITY